MHGRLFAELTVLRRQFAALCLLLLVVPLLVSTLPRPSDAARQYIANLTGISICATDPGSVPVKGNPAPSNPCENSVGCAACQPVALASQIFLEILAPESILAFRLESPDEHVQLRMIIRNNPARAPPVLL